MDSYNIVRMYYSAAVSKRIIARNLTLIEARAHCADPETSSRTATSSTATRRTRRLGDWFDGYEQA